MNLHVKQRIIGLLVLIAILAIFLPLLFHNSHPDQQSMNLAKKIPTPPSEPQVQLQLPTTLPANSVTTVAVAQPATTEQAAAVKPVAAVVKKPVSKPAKKAIVKTATKALLAVSLDAPKAWVLQVASFADPSNVKRLLKTLRASGYNAYARASHRDRRIVGVFVGPEIHKKDIVRIQKTLKKKLHLSGVIQKYTVS